MEASLWTKYSAGNRGYCGNSFLTACARTSGAPLIRLDSSSSSSSRECVTASALSRVVSPLPYASQPALHRPELAVLQHALQHQPGLC